MHLDPVNSAGASDGATRQLESALERIGVTPAHRTMVLLVLLGVMFDVFEQNAVGLIGPILREDWKLGAGDIGFLNTITFAAAAIGRLGSGLLADRFGRRLMLNANLLQFTLGATICALAPNYAVLAAGRFLVGLGLGGEIVTAVTLLSEFCSSRFRGTAVGLINVGGGGLGNMLAPLVAIGTFSVFTGPDRWRSLFAVLVLPAFLVMFFRRFVPETPRYLVSRGRIDEANAVLSRLQAGSFAHKAAPMTAWITSGAVPFEGGFTRTIREVFGGPLLRRTLCVGTASWMTFGAQLTVLTLMPTILVAQGHSITKSYLYTIVLQSGSLLGALAAALLASRVPRKKVLTAASICAVLSGLAFGFMASTPGLILLFGALFQFFVLLCNTSIWIFAPEQYPTRVRAFGTSFILALGTMAGAWTPLLAGRLFDTAGIGGMFSLMAAMYFVFAIVIQFVPETFGRSMEEPNVAPVRGLDVRTVPARSGS